MELTQKQALIMHNIIVAGLRITDPFVASMTTDKDRKDLGDFISSIAKTAGILEQGSQPETSENK